MTKTLNLESFKGSLILHNGLVIYLFLDLFHDQRIIPSQELLLIFISKSYYSFSKLNSIWPGIKSRPSK